MSRNSLTLLTFLIHLGCARDNSELRRELKGESAKNGLAVAEIGDRIAVVPFDGPERYFRSKYGDSIAIVGKAGTMIAWYSIFGPLFFEKIANGAIVGAGRLAYGSSLRALDESSDRLIFLTGGTTHEATISLRWGNVDFSQGGVVSTLPRGDEELEVGWSPDGKVLAYELTGQVYLFDITTSSSRLLVRGHDPTWSPNGKWIAYRTVDEQTALVTPDGTPVNWPGGSHKVVGGSRWSPDGQYVLFSEFVPNPIPVIGAYYRLVICRMKDGANVAVRDFGAGSSHTTLFHWILNYRSFCATCKAGEQFN
jgi:hypothetical protein